MLGFGWGGGVPGWVGWGGVEARVGWVLVRAGAWDGVGLGV